MNSLKLITATLLLLSATLGANSYKQKFLFGRRVGGNVIPPPTASPKSKAFNFEIFDQQVDHFDPTNTQTFPQRYAVNSEHFANASEKKVAYLFISGESEASLSWMDYGLWTQGAEDTKALLVQLEHRYYGTSQPYNNLTTENMRHLTSEQALADAANFIQFINEKYNLGPNVKWITFGGSYAGSLSAWIRLKYPHLVYAAVASSGPLLAKLDFKEYLEVVIEDMRLVSQECVDTVKEGTAQISAMVDNNQFTELANLFNFCDNVDPNNLSTLDISNIYSTISGIFSGNAQYDGIAGSVVDACESLTDGSNSSNPNDSLDRLVKFVSDNNGGGCLDINYEEMVEYYRNVDIDGTGGMRQWLFQTCNEFGFYQTSDQEVGNQVFGDRFPLSVSVQFCQDLFGSKYNETFLNKAINATNIQYGATDIPTDKILFTYGTVDPWHALGKLNSTNSQSPVIVVTGASHCADMYNVGTSPIEELENAKLQILTQISTWVNSN